MSIVNTINRLRRTVGLKDFTPTYSDTEPEPKTTINDQITDSVTTEMPEIDIPGGDDVDIMQEFEPLDAEVSEMTEEYDESYLQYSSEVVGFGNREQQWNAYRTVITYTGTEDSFLDFGCGTGRNIRNCQHIVGSIAGVDFIHQNMEHASTYLTFCGYNRFDFIFYDTNGYDLTNIADNTYDCIISSLTMQKIEIYDIRYNYFREFLRVLKPGGEISIQMGYGSPDIEFVSYNNNTWDDLDETPENNPENNPENYFSRFKDVFNEVSVDNVSEIQNDLDNIGFINFTYELAPPGPGSTYPQWIYFKGFKPQLLNLQTEAPIISESKLAIIQ